MGFSKLGKRKGSWVVRKSIVKPFKTAWNLAFLKRNRIN